MAADIVRNIFLGVDSVLCAAQIVDEIARIKDRGQQSTLSHPAVNGARITLKIGEIVINILRMSCRGSQVQYGLSQAELPVRIADYFLQIHKGMEELQKDPSLGKFLEKSILPALTAIIRTGVEFHINRAYARGSSEEFEGLRNAADTMRLIETVANAGLFSYGFKGGADLYQALDRGVRHRHRQAVQARAVQEFLPEIPLDPFDSSKWKEIPPELHEDPIFKNLECPINLVPIRDPVGDPNGVAIYERAAILKHLAGKPESPMTREPLTPEMLIERPDLKKIIDDRLKLHEEELRKFLQQRISAGVGA